MNDNQISGLHNVVDGGTITLMGWARGRNMFSARKDQEFSLKGFWEDTSRGGTVFESLQIIL